MIELPRSSISPIPSSSGSAIRTFAVGERPPDAARTPRVRPIAGEQRRGLRQPVSGQHRPAESFEPLLGFLFQPRSARNQQPQPRGDSAPNRGEQQPSQTQPGRALHEARRSQQRAPQEPRCPAARRDARFERRPYRVVEARHADDRGDLGLAHRPHQQRAGRAARQDDRGSDGQGGQHADDKRDRRGATAAAAARGPVGRRHSVSATPRHWSRCCGGSARMPWASRWCRRSRTTVPARRGPGPADPPFFHSAATATSSQACPSHSSSSTRTTLAALQDFAVALPGDAPS